MNISNKSHGHKYKLHAKFIIAYHSSKLTSHSSTSLATCSNDPCSPERVVKYGANNWWQPIIGSLDYTCSNLFYLCHFIVSLY